MRRETKFTSISNTVRRHVYDRDNGRCVLCGVGGILECAHYIPRSLGGLGREKNLIMLCTDCHRKYDQSGDRKMIKNVLAEYLISQYPDWDESELAYKKGI